MNRGSDHGRVPSGAESPRIVNSTNDARSANLQRQ